MAHTWKFWQKPTWMGKPKRHLKKKTSPLYSISDHVFTDGSGRLFQQWASENQLSSHPQEMLALGHIDSMSPVPYLTSDRMQDTPVTEEELGRLLLALRRLSRNEIQDEPGLRTAGFRRVTSSLAISGSREQTGVRITPRPVSLTCVDEDTLRYDIGLDSDGESADLHGSSTEDIDGSARKGVEQLLGLMVELNLITKPARKDLLSATCPEECRERLTALTQFANTPATDVSRDALKASPSDNRVKGSQGRKVSGKSNTGSVERILWDSKISNTKNTDGRHCCSSSKDTSPINPHVCVGEDDDAVAQRGEVNPLFEEDNELPHFLLTFGKKGRGFGRLQDASSVVCAGDGHTIVTDFVNSKIQMFDQVGKPSWEITDRDRRGPWNVALSPHGWIAVTFRGSKRLTFFSQGGKELFSAGRDIFESPAGLAVDHHGRYIVTDCVTNKVHRLSFCPDENLVRSECLNSRVQLNQPRYVTVSPTGSIIVSDTGNNCIKILTPDGELECEFGQYGRRHGNFRSPYAVCCDHHGNIIVADHYNNRVSMFDSRGIFIRHILSEHHGLNRPQGLCISADRKLYVTHGRIKAFEVLVFNMTDEADKVRASI